MTLMLAIAFWIAAWVVNEGLARSRYAGSRLVRIVIPTLFGVAVLMLWQGIVEGFGVAEVILPAPSRIGGAIAENLPLLWVDFVQTILKGGLTGYVTGSAAAVVVAVLVDKVPFLRAGLLPIGNFAAALPIVGIAPIMVMWFGFDWHSKAAVVVVMVFFPVLVNMVAGLSASERMQRDLMATWGASYWQTLFKLRLPAAMPFLFNGLKIAATLALIGAIVAENFGSPTVGMGFRISTAVGQLALPLVWAEIAVAALAGSVFYGLVAATERAVTFWHPSQRGR
ncbi:MAG: ABC transporter permease [Cypionkella sp.]